MRRRGQRRREATNDQCTLTEHFAMDIRSALGSTVARPPDFEEAHNHARAKQASFAEAFAEDDFLRQ